MPAKKKKKKSVPKLKPKTTSKSAEDPSPNFRLRCVKSVRVKLQTELTAKNERKKEILRDRKRYEVFEAIINKEELWAHHLEWKPGELCSDMLVYFKLCGDLDSLYTCAMGMCQQIHLAWAQKNLAKKWRQRMKQALRRKLSGQNEELNELDEDISNTEATLSTWVEGQEYEVVKKKAPHEVIDLQSSSSDEDDEQDEQDEGPDTDTDTNKDEGPDTGIDTNKDEGPDTGTDFGNADRDFHASTEIPKTEKARTHFRKWYPNGYPDDEDFVTLDHYVQSVRTSKTGFQGVMSSGHGRDKSKKWRVKVSGTTIGRYRTKAQACEEAYWHTKHQRQLEEFAAGDTVPSAMFDD